MKIVLLTALAAISLNLGAAQAKSPDERPGWTGRIFVTGSHSTIAGNRDATRIAQTSPSAG